MPVSIEKNAFDVLDTVGVGIIEPQTERALERVGAGYAADTEHRCWLWRRHPRGRAFSTRPGFARARGGQDLPSTASSALLIFDNLEHDFATVPRRDRIEDRTDRFRRATLFANHAPQVLFRHPQFKYRGGIALRLLHIHRLRFVHQLLSEELNEILHRMSPMQRVASSGDRCGFFSPFD